MPLTPAELKSHVQSDLPDAELQSVINGMEAEIDQRIGPLGVLYVETLVGGTDELFPSRPVVTVSQIEEAYDSDEAPLVVDPAEYRVLLGGGILKRRNGRSWRTYVTVTYMVKQDEAIRRQVVIDLCKLELNYRGISRHAIGDYSESGLDQLAERERILSRIAPWRVAVA